jgi:1-acyl-sn-glycerol-3-phosphate acyltransferase
VRNHRQFLLSKQHCWTISKKYCKKNSMKLHSASAHLRVKHPGVYAAAMQAMGIAAKLKGGISFSGHESLPNKGPYLLAANHSSILDPPILGAALLSASGDNIHFLANEELWQKKIEVGEKVIRMGLLSRPFGALLDACGAMPIARNKAPSAKLNARVADVIARNGIIGIFPEGGLRHELVENELHAGVGVLAARYGLKIVPVGIAGSDYMAEQDGQRDFGDFHVHFGEPIITELVPKPEFIAAGRARMPLIFACMQSALDAARAQRS